MYVSILLFYDKVLELRGFSVMRFHLFIYLFYLFIFFFLQRHFMSFYPNFVDWNSFIYFVHTVLFL